MKKQWNQSIIFYYKKIILKANINKGSIFFLAMKEFLKEMTSSRLKLELC